MTLFNRDTLRAAYNYLNETPPFNKWNLPDGDDIEFIVARAHDHDGWHTFKDGKHTIAISTTRVGFTDTLLRTMAHEMVHLHEQHSGACSSGHHGKTFRRFAAQVCAAHGFDPKGF